MKNGCDDNNAISSFPIRRKVLHNSPFSGSPLNPKPSIRLWSLAILFSITVSAAATAQGVEAVVPFNDGFIGLIGNNSQDAEQITSFSTLGIKRAFFVQVTQSGQFELKPGPQGNDILLTLRLEMPNGQLVDIPGGIYWQKKELSVTKVFGFLADPAVSFNLSVYGGTPFQISGGSGSGKSNFGLGLIGSGLTFTDGSGIKGDASTASLLESLNTYLSKVRSLSPSGPVTVNNLTTCLLTPTITGTAVLADAAPALERLAVSVNGRLFRTVDDGLVIGKGNWTLALPASVGLVAGETYSITATITNADGYTLSDLTGNELVITTACDADGDGVEDGRELADGTNPDDVCSFVEASRTLPVSLNWKSADCDGDGDKNETDPSPGDPCIAGAGAIPNNSSAIWGLADCDGDGVANAKEVADGTSPFDPCKFLAGSQTLPLDQEWKDADCDGDGVTNGKELSDGTDAEDPCSLIKASQTLVVSAEWLNADCDGDGDPNGTDTDPASPCTAAAASIPDYSNLVWQAADCDGDGVPNGRERLDATDPTDPCALLITSQSLLPSASWKSGDCDGDGVTNERELTDGTGLNGLCSLLYSSQTLPPSQTWLNGDCDGDGDSNKTDADPSSPCITAVGSTPDSSNGIWRSADCDGDGVTNGREVTDGTDPVNPCSLLAESQDAVRPVSWLLLDCDKDGNKNGTDKNPLVPVATDDLVGMKDGERVTYNVLANDDFIPSNRLTMDKVGGDADGEYSFSPEEGTVTYRNSPNESGMVSFEYRVCNSSVDPQVCAVATITIDIDVSRLIIPEAFTPNGNGKNDKWVIRGLAGYPDNRLVIFNRWGSRVFEASPYRNDWDGNSNGGVRLPAGSYFYSLDLGDGQRRTGYVYIAF